MSLKNSSYISGIVWFIVIIGVPIGVLLTISGTEIPAFAYVIWGFAFFILCVSAVLENRPGGPDKN